MYRDNDKRQEDDFKPYVNRGQAKPLRPRHDNYEPRHEKNWSALNPSRTLSTIFYVLWAKSAPLCMMSRSAVPPLGVNLTLGSEGNRPPPIG